MKYALVSSLMPESTVRVIEGDDFSVIPLPPYEMLPRPVCTHPDMLVFIHGDTLYTFGGYYEQNSTLFDSLPFDIKTVKEPAGQVYPRDIPLNAFELGGRLYGRLDSVSKDIRKLYTETRNVKQGYAACSACIIGNVAAISADAGICCALREDGVDTLEISAGDILLPGYEYGFVGGASFYDGNGTVIFFGDIKSHRDGGRIASFLHDHGIKAVCCDGALTDIGGVKILNA